MPSDDRFVGSSLVVKLLACFLTVILGKEHCKSGTA